MKKINIACISDMHGNLDFKIDPCDLLIIAGDICPAWGPVLSIELQANWLADKFRPWIAEQPVEEIVGIGGNHDWIWDTHPGLVPHIHPNFHYLCDESIEIMDLKIYGTPQQKYFNGWAFNRTTKQLEKYFSEIPEGLDILISHTPPYKIFDKVDFTNYKGHEGCKVLKKRLREMKEPPKIFVSGHFHGEYGVKEVDYMPGIKFVSSSLLNEQYKMDKKPIYLEL